ncbi:MAG TPA: efflux RND transporter permease subunit, partial [Woeseiaceae bacterium]|nr:efflux RND transporter permease subunit [Woeseiaceae bacterium]
EHLAARLVPADFRLSAGYDAGREATERVFSVLNQLLTGTLIVVAIIWLGLGWRAALVIALMMPASLAVVPYAYYQLGYTLNPVSIAAMILAIGILADDAIIMLENIARRFRRHGERNRELTVEAVDEVGNPTILADLLIVATLLPTAYITGEMGQYTRAIPLGASIAVLFSLLIALSITPYFGFRLLRPGRGAHAPAGVSARAREEDDGSHFARVYRRLLTPFLDRAALRWGLYAVMLAMLVGAFALVAARQVQIGLTPLLDRKLFVVEIEMPRGAPLTTSLAAAGAAARELRRIPEVEAYSVYAGLSPPMVLPPAEAPSVERAKPETLSLHVELVPEEARERLSYVITRALAVRLDQALAPWSAHAYVRRIPSGPSADRPVEAEIYADEAGKRLTLAEGVADVLGGLEAVTAVQQTPREAPPALSVKVDQTRSAARGVIPGEAARVVRIALAGATPASVDVPDSRRPVPIVVRLARAQRRETGDLAALYVAGANDSQVPLLDVVTVLADGGRRERQRRNARPLVYVGADLDRSMAEPLTVQQQAGGPIAGLAPSPALHWFSPPPPDQRTAVYWGGEWETTQQVYRDLGVAGAVVMTLVYVLLAGWFRSYGAPLLIMLPIPLIFIGVIPAHWLWGIDIAGTGVMGMIALIGIVARNAVLLVDFVQARRAERMDIREAVIQAGALRTRPILLTAATVMFGSGVLIFEPALEPLGLTLASGVLVSTLLTLVLIPVLYVHAYADGNRRAGGP